MGHRIGIEYSTRRKLELPLQYLKDITDNFSSDREIGRGGFGVVYKVYTIIFDYTSCNTLNNIKN